MHLSLPEPRSIDAENLAPQIIWIQNSVEHYFCAMIDLINRQMSEIRFHAVFLCERPANPTAENLPKESTYTFMPANLQRGPIEKGPIGKIPFTAAIIGGYNTRFKLRFVGYCNKKGRPAILFADSNIRSDRGKSIVKKLKRGAKKAFLSRLQPKLATVITCNRYGAAYWRYYGANRDRICRSTYFCDIEKISTAVKSNGNELRLRYGISPTGRLIFTAARLVPVKALNLMIRAFASLRLGETGWIWAVAGTGPLRDELTRQARKSAGDAIKFLGFVPPDDVKAIAANSELFVLPSTYEPHGIVVSEAMAVGTPVIASDVCGAAGDLVVPGKTGWIFKSGSTESLGDALATATSSRDRLRAMRPDCQQLFAHWYDLYCPERRIPEALAKALRHEATRAGSSGPPRAQGGPPVL